LKDSHLLNVSLWKTLGEWKLAFERFSQDESKYLEESHRRKMSLWMILEERELVFLIFS